jgi:hypothetical protein
VSSPQFERNYRFYDMRQGGARWIDIARDAGISRSRVQIIVMRCERLMAYPDRARAWVRPEEWAQIEQRLPR